MSNNLMTAEEIAEYLQISLKNVYHLANNGSLPATRIGNKWLFPRQIVDNWIYDSARKNISPHLSESHDVFVSIGSNDYIWEILSDEMHQHPYNLALPHASVGSSGGLRAVHERKAHGAGIHLYDAAAGVYNTTFLSRYCSGDTVTLIHLFNRRQGLIVPPGNPKSISRMQDIARKDVRFINRREGSGTRVLLDAFLEKEKIPAGEISGYDTSVNTHFELAMAVRNGSADTGIGIETAAAVSGLDFIPIQDERYDLIVMNDYLNHMSFGVLYDFLKSKKFRSRLTALPGYDLNEIGTVVWEGKVS